jgi:hypothetical protein
MSDTSDVALGLGGGAVITAATMAAGLGAMEPLLIGGGAGLVLALTPRSRPAGVALLLASIVGAAVVASRPRRRQRLLTE